MSVPATENPKHLYLGISTLDAAFSGFAAGDFAVLCGNASSFIVHYLAVKAQLPIDKGGLDSATVFVDGANSFDIYSTAEIGRDYGLDPRTVLEKIYVSRAFNPYQLSTLICEKLHSALTKTKAKLLVVSDIATLFLNNDLPKAEGRELFTKTCGKLADIAGRKQAIVLVKYSARNSSKQDLFFETVLFGKCDILINIKKRERKFTFILRNHPSLESFSVDFTVDHNTVSSSSSNSYSNMSLTMPVRF